MGLPVEARCQLGVEASNRLLDPNVSIIVSKQSEKIFSGTTFLFLDQNSEIGDRDKSGQNLEQILLHTWEVFENPRPARNKYCVLNGVSFHGHFKVIFRV